jgi:hypothetical protein
VPVTSITLVAVGFVSPWPRPSGLDNPALPAASASFPVRLFSLEPPPCPCPHTHSGLTLGSSGLTGTSEHLEHRADGGGPTPTATAATAATAVTVAAISGLSAARRAASSEVRRTCEKSNPRVRWASGAAVAARCWRCTGRRAGPAPCTRRPRLTRTRSVHARRCGSRRSAAAARCRHGSGAPLGVGWRPLEAPPAASRPPQPPPRVRVGVQGPVDAAHALAPHWWVVRRPCAHVVCAMHVAVAGARSRAARLARFGAP